MGNNLVLCANCGEREATGQWLGVTGCMLCAARSGLAHLPWWCERCIVTAQIAYMSEIASKLPARRERLSQLEG